MPGRETMAERTKRAALILRGLQQLYPDADCELHRSNGWELLVATILSAQCTDETVNKLTPVLFARFPSIEALANADPGAVEEIVHAAGFYRQKTKSIIGAARQIMEEFGGQLPSAMDDLLKLPGVARKTANVVLGTWFGRNEGVVVDTHVGRLAERMKLTWTGRDSKDAVRIEADLMRLIPRDDWTFFGHALVWHGRRVCTARKPDCAACRLAKHCPSAGNGVTSRAAKRGRSLASQTNGPAARQGDH